MRNISGKTITLGAAILTLGCVVAQAFEMPNAAQVAAAAGDPAALIALARGAAPEQAAEILTAGLARLANMETEPSRRLDLVAQHVTRFMAAFNAGQQAEFARALGQSVGGNTVLRGLPAIISAIQEALARANGSTAHGFGSAYLHAAGIGVAGAGRPDSSPSMYAPPVGSASETDDSPTPQTPTTTPSKPPVASGYPNQPI